MIHTEKKTMKHKSSTLTEVAGCNSPPLRLQGELKKSHNTSTSTVKMMWIYRQYIAVQYIRLDLTKWQIWSSGVQWTLHFFLNGCNFVLSCKINNDPQDNRLKIFLTASWVRTQIFNSINLLTSGNIIHPPSNRRNNEILSIVNILREAEWRSLFCVKPAGVDKRPFVQ